jgi:Tol biopolymer transport system component
MWLKNASGPPFQLVSWYGADSWMAGDFSWSPDGTHIAYRITGPEAGLYIANSDGTGRTQVGETGDGTLADVPPSWSPDGTHIAYSISTSEDRYDVYVAALSAGGSTQIVTGKDPVWSPDGSSIAFVAGGGIGVVNPDGDDLAIAGPEGYEFAWSPDGSRIVYHVERRDKASDPFHEELWVVSPDGSDRVNVLPVGCCPHGIVDEGFTWSPDGTRVTFVDASVEGQWVLTRSDGSDADVPLSDHDRIDLTRWLSWQPCLCTAGPYA